MEARSARIDSVVFPGDKAMKPSRSGGEGREKISYVCPGCTKILRIRKSYVGCHVSCKDCHHDFYVKLPGHPDPTNQIVHYLPGRGRSERRNGPELNRIESSIKSAESRLDALDAGVASHREEFVHFSEEMIRLISLVSEAHQRVADIGKDVRRLQEDRQGFEQRASQAMQARVESVLLREREDVEGRIASLLSLVDGIREDSRELARNDAEQDRRMEAIEGDVSRAMSGLSANSGEIERIRGTIAELLAAEERRVFEERASTQARAEERARLEDAAIWHEEIRARLDDVCSRHGLLEDRLVEHGRIQAGLESTVSGLAADGQRLARESEDHWQMAEAQISAQWKSLDELQDLIQLATACGGANPGRDDPRVDRLVASPVMSHDVPDYGGVYGQVISPFGGTQFQIQMANTCDRRGHGSPPDEADDLVDEMAKEQVGAELARYPGKTGA